VGAGDVDEGKDLEQIPTIRCQRSHRKHQNPSPNSLQTRAQTEKERGGVGLSLREKGHVTLGLSKRCRTTNTRPQAGPHHHINVHVLQATSKSIFRSLRTKVWFKPIRAEVYRKGRDRRKDPHTQEMAISIYSYKSTHYTYSTLFDTRIPLPTPRSG